MDAERGWLAGDTDSDGYLPEWAPFVEAFRKRDPAAGTACAAWTTFDIVAHNAGTLEEESRALEAFVAERPIPATRSFTEREAPYRAMTVRRVDAALHAQMDRFATAARAAEARAAEAMLPWTGREMKVRWFAEHIREELALHRWDLVGDDVTSGEVLAQDWVTVHSVEAVGAPLLRRGLERLHPHAPGWDGRIRVEGRDDLLVEAADGRATVQLVPPAGAATITTDASTRVLLLWGRQPADCARWHSEAGEHAVGRLRTLLSGY